ncbi:Crp/Fnr family transcriptional regulator [Streptomyces asoensis]|uniref:Crp/Fnr family transcriptional regulator n=1 Tax=Streptomyces asoensis TaxID=249586 RepID=UPI00371173E6
MTEIIDFESVTPIRSWSYDASASYLRSLGLPAHAVELLLSAARVEARHRGGIVAYGQEWIHIVTLGLVKETTPHGTTRLWRRGAVLGDISRVLLRKRTTDESGSPGSGPHITFLSHNGVILSLTTRTLATLVEREPALALFLAQLTNDRAQNVESVYAVSKADPVVRVARLLRYLVVPLPRAKDARRYRWTRNGMHDVPVGALPLMGPSQADISDALGLGRTTVEKAIAFLRGEGVLNALPPGTRSNRYYEIMDYARLTSLARSES